MVSVDNYINCSLPMFFLVLKKIKHYSENYLVKNNFKNTIQIHFLSVIGCPLFIHPSNLTLGGETKLEMNQT